MERTVYVGSDFIGIEKPNGGCYEIPFDRCKSEAEILHWVTHLSLKTWFTREMLRDFLPAAYRVAGISYY